MHDRYGIDRGFGRRKQTGRSDIQTNNHHLIQDHSEIPTETTVRLDEVLPIMSHFIFCVQRIIGSPLESVKMDPIHSLKARKLRLARSARLNYQVYFCLRLGCVLRLYPSFGVI